MATRYKSINSRPSGSSFIFALALGVTCTLIAGVLYGRYSQRWGPPADLVAAAEHLKSMPKNIGPWQLAEELTMGKSARQMLECAGYVNRRYVNQESGKVVNLAVIVGPPGPTAVHTPEICYSSRAYKLRSARQRIHVGDAPADRHSFWGVDFQTTNALADGLRVYYAWSLGGHWVSSDSPRFEFAAAPLLYKLQLAGAIETQDGSETQDPGKEFLEELIRSDWKLASK